MSITITKTITDDQLACLSNDLAGFPNDVPKMTAELQRRIDWVIDHKVEQCEIRIIRDSENILGDTIPRDRTERVQQIVQHPDFKTRDQRDADSVGPGRTE